MRKTHQEIIAYTKYLVENYQSLRDEDIKFNEVKWGFLSCQWRYKITEDFIVRFKKHLDSYYLSERSNFSAEFIDDNINWLGCWSLMQITKTVTHKLVLRYLEYVDNNKRGYINKGLHIKPCHNMSMRTPLEYVEMYPDYFDWEVISERDDLTREFFDRNINKINLAIFLEFSKSKKKILSKQEVNKFILLNRIR